MPTSIARYPEPPRPQPTGRLLVRFHPTAELRGMAGLVERATGLRVMSASEAGAAPGAGDAIMIDRFKVAAIPAPVADAMGMTALQQIEGVLAVRPEFYMFTIAELQRRYAEWVREGLRILVEGAPAAMGARGFAGSRAALAGPGFADTDELTWGLTATGVDQTSFTGRGVKAAVLDTGLDLGHPDFAGRAIVTRSFVEGQEVQDGQGHGTHTAGTVAGPMRSTLGRRYGVAPEVDLHIGKVLNDQGSGREMDILNGIDWAIGEGCAVISMSLGRAVQPGEGPDPVYEEVGAAALRAGSLIIAAAGNESARDSGFVAPVGAPANSPSIVAVAAVDPNLEVAPFSSGGINPEGGDVDVSGPGVSVYSSFPRPRLTRLLQGTSMACPHAAGMAALWAESDAELRGQKLWDALARNAQELGSARDYGRGLVMAPKAKACA